MSAITATTDLIAAAPIQPAVQKPNAATAQANTIQQAAAATPTAPQRASAPAQATAPQGTATASSAAQAAPAQPTSSQVALLSAEGESIAEIAQQLGISQQAVQSYLG